MARVRSSLLAAGVAAAVLSVAAPAYAAAPPTTVTGLTKRVGSGQVTLRWTNPADADFAGVTVVQKSDGTTPTAIGDGTTRYAGTGTATTVTGLTNGTTYTFAVFTRNTADEVSDPAVVTATPVPAVVTRLALTVSPRIATYGTRPRVTAVLTRADTGAAVPGEAVYLYRKPSGATSWQKAYKLTTNASGVVTTLTNSTKNTLWYAAHVVTPYFGGSKSAERMSYVKPRLSVTRTPATVQQNQASVVRVAVAPNHAGQKVLLQRRVDGEWRSLASKYLSSTSTASFSVRTDVVGTRYYRVVKPKDADHATAYFRTFGIITVQRTLKAGMSGADVTKVQKRLAALRYDVGSISGSFGYDTVHATMAFQKVNRLPVTGQVNSTTYKKLWSPTVPRLRYPQSGSWVEADLTKQVLYVTKNGALWRILDISSGSGEYYYVDGETHRAVTPTGSFRVMRKIDGMRVSRLGELWRPAYFAAGGYAIHGSGNVPAYPDSHGCIRITNPGMNRLFYSLPIGMRVYVYRS